ncbi:hypothetical protein GCM10009557_11450 [Virgisporangium ochraceum]|uniref:HTH cro/C1-type domain-containing protein n=1 Tax=Virgisporangium ochraceum TaxID=65505 RepID=A0A8J3ZYY2_9ACTN|nr:helix-turn-helix transcriptional regulator [Virgisporangium ochraceum]GIJ69906.1 hypothetical protein Voc01_048230 [Virgisporangium ochraceum]
METVTEDRTAKNPLGPTGRRAAERVRMLREQQKLQFKELSERLAALGRPIAALGLSRIEKGERRIDADDLVALALAFGVTPLALLLPNISPTGITWRPDSVDLTSERAMTFPEAWRWATGVQPPDAISLSESLRWAEYLSPLADAAKSGVLAGIPAGKIRALVGQAIEEALAQRDEEMWSEGEVPDSQFDLEAERRRDDGR